MASARCQLTIREAAGGPDLVTVRRLLHAYARWLDIDLGFQSFDQELATLPGLYAKRAGVILRAEFDGTIAGCAALRPLGDGIAEAKRLYVEPRYRGRGIGRRLMIDLIGHAHRKGYSRLRLDTIPKAQAARALYLSLGFREIAPYYRSPIEGTAYLELRLP